MQAPLSGASDTARGHYKIPSKTCTTVRESGIVPTSVNDPDCEEVCSAPFSGADRLTDQGGVNRGYQMCTGIGFLVIGFWKFVEEDGS
jgi:hypothetical protein